MVLTGGKKRPKIEVDMKKISRSVKKRTLKKKRECSGWRHYVGPPKKKKIYYTCPICGKKKVQGNRTAIHTGVTWIMGCQDCFLNSIDKPANLDRQKSNL
jgi:hypothetical protein